MTNPQTQPLLRRSYWSTLEEIPGIALVAADWRARLGDDYESFSGFLAPIPIKARSVPCPRQCGCAHEVSFGRDGSMLGLCRCKGWGCADLNLKPEDIVIWELNWPRLARAICQALGLTSKFEDFGPNGTVQIGTWSADSVPAFLTIQWDETQFRHVVASLVALQKKPFILLAPTSAHMDATSQSYLTSVGAEFFPLETTLNLTENGTFQPTRLPGEIFARFAPQPLDDVEMLRTMILLVKATDGDQGARKVTLYMVMRLFCFDWQNPKQIARTCGCALSLVYARLEELHEKLKRDPAELRAYCSQFESMEDSFSDPRAKSIYRKGT